MGKQDEETPNVVEVQGKGHGTVVSVEQAKGKSTLHVVDFDNGGREAVLLSKDPLATNGKGSKFWLLEEAVQTRAAPSRSQC